MTMDVPNRQRGVVWAAAAVLCALSLGPGTAFGQAEAGNDARFRVIERFPDADEEKGDNSNSESDALELAVSRQLAEAIQRGDWDEAAKMAGRRIGEDQPRHAFLDGYIAWNRRRWKRARESFDRAAREWSKLGDYCAYFAAAASLEVGNAHQAVVRAARVPTSSRLFGDALSVMTRGLLETGTRSDRSQAIQVASRYLDHFPHGEHAQEMRLDLTRLHLDNHDWRLAADQAFTLLEQHPLSAEASEAEKLLERHKNALPDEIRKKVDEPPQYLQLAYLEALYEHHRSERLIAEASERVEKWTPGSRPWCRTMYWIGRSHTKLRRHDEAADWYERILDKCAGVEPFERNALYVGGKSYWNAGQKQDALTMFERLWTDYDDHSFADDGMYFAARIYRELDKIDRAVDLLGRQVDRYPSGDMAANAHWLRVRAMFREENYDRVVAYVDSLQATGENEPYTRGRMDYYKGRALEAQGKQEAARQQYESVAGAHPLRFYALLAVNRIAAMDGVQPGTDICEAKPRLCRELMAAGESEGDDRSFVPSLSSEVRNARSFRRGAALLRLGIREWARDEFDRLFERFAGDDRALLALADLLDRAGAHDFAYGLPARIDGWRERYPDEQTRRPWTISYPRAFRQVVDKWTEKRDLPRALVWAIMRKESGYNAGIESWANARGLMQLMEPTAESVADRVGMNGLEPSDLLDAETNVRLGTAYLDMLAGQLDARPALMATGYNGGMGNVSGWLQERGDLPLDLWIEDIPYGQTRRYAKVVLANYWTYRWLYGGREIPRLDFDISQIQN